MVQGCVTKLGLTLAVFLALGANAADYPSVPGQYIVKLKNVAMVQSMGQKQIMGANVKETLSSSLGLVLVEKPIIETKESAMASLSAASNVEYVEPNYLYRVVSDSPQMAPTDPEFLKLWGLQNTGQETTGDQGRITGRAGMDIGAIEAWKTETGSKDIIVAVIDTGVDYRNPDLKDNIYTNLAELNGQPGVDDDGNGYIDDIHGYDIVKKDADPTDVYGHGTHVAGTIGASANNGAGIVGVAWNVSILPIRFLDDNGGGNLADAIKCIDYATKMKVHIMNNSWGGGGYSQAMYDSIVAAKNAGILFLAAAGNNGADNDRNAFYPAGYQVDNVMAVAAISPTGNLANFSNYGKTTVHIAAPGVNVLSHTMRGLQSWSGTSMATPHVAGIAALMLSHDRNLTYMDLKTRLMATSVPLAGLKNRIVTGGLANAYYALNNMTPPSDKNDPSGWAQSAQPMASEHPYANGTKSEWTFHVPGATRMAVHFSRFETEANYDVVHFHDGKGNLVGSTSGMLGDTFGPVVDGDTIVMSLVSDGSVNEYGFDASGVAYETTAPPGVVAAQ